MSNAFSRPLRIFNNSITKRRTQQPRRFSPGRPKRLDSIIFWSSVCVLAVILTIGAKPLGVIPGSPQREVLHDPGHEPGRPGDLSKLGGADQSPASSLNLAEQPAPFRAFIDARRTLHIEGTEAAETIIAEVITESGLITIDYRTDGTREPWKLSFRLDAFDRLNLNARGGPDFVNIIDAAELLDRKGLKLDGGDGDNSVVFSHLPFKPETATQIRQLQYLSLQIEEVAKRAGNVISQALANDAMQVIESNRVSLADESKSMVADVEKQLFSPGNDLVERGRSELTGLSNALIKKSDALAKLQASLVAELIEKYSPPDSLLQQDDNREPPDAGNPDADLSSLDPREREAEGARARAERLSLLGIKLGDDAKAELDRMGKQMQIDAAVIENRAAEFDTRGETLSARADLFAAQGEQEMSTAADRVLAAIADLRTLEESFAQTALALREELTAASKTRRPNQKKTAGATSVSCSTPIVTTRSYTGGGGSDFFFPSSAPSQNWSINGGAGNDFLFGGFADDDIHGGPGNDFVFGLDGNDQIHGDNGTDLLVGEFVIDISSMTGDDCVWGDNGVDLVIGDNIIDTSGGTAGGADQLWGGTNIDIMIGDDLLSDIFSQTHPGGNDTIEGNNDTDIMFGCGGNDNIKGNAGMDFAEGNGGEDIIDGSDGRNFTLCNTTVQIGNLLLGGKGNDDLSGGAGIDVIFGNDGDDMLTGKGQIDIEFGGRGKDTMNGNAGGTICIISGIPIRLGNLMFGGTEDDQMRAGGDLDIMFGQDGDDRVRGYDGSLQLPFAVDADLLFGGDGNDYLEGDNEPTLLRFSLDFIFGGPGDDEIHGGSAIDLLFGGAGKDRLHGDSNKLILIASIDLIFGGPDDDRMDGGNSLDLVFGQDGDDTMLGDNEDPLIISPDLMFGGPGADTMNGGCSFDFMSGADGADHMLGDSNFVWEVLSIDFMFAGSGADFMDGGNATDLMFGGHDGDTMRGDNSAGFILSVDFMFGEGGDDDMDGGNSIDFMWGGEDHDKMVGDRQFSWQPLSVDWMWGNEGCDNMLGGRALDWMWGGPSVDQIDGQIGPDMMFGGANSDIMNGGDLLDFIWGNEGNDLIHGNNFIDVISGGDGQDCLYGDDGPDLAWGDDGDDCLHGGNHSDRLSGDTGNDLIFGDNGPDRLFGESGADKLDGGNAADRLVGGPGTDELWGGPGLDILSGEIRHQSGSSGLDCNCQIDTCTGRICVHKFNDLNGDGVRNNGEPGLQNWVFQIQSPGAGAQLITDASGNACRDFSKGIYSVVEQMQSGWTATTPTTQTANVIVGQVTNVNFGNKMQGTGELCIYKFHDMNRNGIQDAAEPRLPNWSFIVTDPNGTVSTLVTDSLGRICNTFPLGTYSVVEEPQTGWTPTTPTTQTVVVTAGTGSKVTFGNSEDDPNACTDPPPQMVAWWPLDDLSGDSVVDDIIGLPDNGSPKPGPTVGPSSPSSVAAVVGTGLNFLSGASPTGPNYYLEVPTSPELNFGTDDFTIDAWIKLGQAGQIHPIVDKLDFSTPGSGTGYAFFVQSGSLLLRIGPAGNALVAGASTGTQITSGVWHHVAVTVRRNDPGDKPIITFYIDGVLSGSGPPPGPTMPGSISIDTTTPLWIGGNSRLFGQGVVGLGEIAIDELEFFKRELTQAEIQAIVAAKSAGKCKCLFATNETIIRNANGQYSYTATLTNLSSSTLSGATFSPISNVTITPSSVVIPPLAPGASTVVTVTISGPDAISGATICFSVGSAGQLGQFSCELSHCITLPT